MTLTNGLGKEYAEAEASGTTDFERLPAGGYVCKITGVDDCDGQSPYLRVVYDINDGEYAMFYSDDWGQSNEWAHESRHYYTPKAMGMFKGFLKCLDESNGTNFSEQAETGFDVFKLIGLKIGYVIGEEEYEGNDGSIKTRLKVRQTKTVQQIRDGKFKQPELKTLSSPASSPKIEPQPVDAAGLPF